VTSVVFALVTLVVLGTNTDAAGCRYRPLEAEATMAVIGNSVLPESVQTESKHTRAQILSQQEFQSRLLVTT